MADIMKCKGKGCPLKDKCYRHTARSGFWQSWFGTPPWNWREKCCHFYWDNHKNEE